LKSGPTIEVVERDALQQVLVGDAAAPVLVLEDGLLHLGEVDLRI